MLKISSLVSQAFPPEGTDGIARYNSTLAKSLADDGNRVFVITKNSEKGTKIEYRDKFWIYYHDPEELKQRVVGYDRADSLIALAKSSPGHRPRHCKEIKN
jgi:hypothetical protein